MSKLRLGYIGVGLMGLPMVKHILPKGYDIAVYDIVDTQREAAQAAGAKIAASAAQAVPGADIVVLNLPTVDAVEAVVEQIVTTLKPPQIVCDFSTIHPEKSRAFAKRVFEATGCRWVDTPVSGGPPASGTGSLTCMVGGREEDVARVAPFLKDVTQRFTHMGPQGAGLATKMINQMIVGCGHALMAEAMIMAEAAGLDAKRIPECLTGGLADSPILQRLYPRMAARDFAPHGYARQLLKDLEIVSAFAAEKRAPIPMTGEALNLYRLLVHLGHSELDSTAVVKVFSRD